MHLMIGSREGAGQDLGDIGIQSFQVLLQPRLLRSLFPCSKGDERPWEGTNCCYSIQILIWWREQADPSSPQSFSTARFVLYLFLFLWRLKKIQFGGNRSEFSAFYSNKHWLVFVTFQSILEFIRAFLSMSGKPWVLSPLRKWWPFSGSKTTFLTNR